MSAPFTTDLFGKEIMERTAIFSGEERLELGRRWGPGPIACVIGCNPSTADANGDDPTSLWWNAWFQLFGFGFAGLQATSALHQQVPAAWQGKSHDVSGRIVGLPIHEARRTRFEFIVDGDTRQPAALRGSSS